MAIKILEKEKIADMADAIRVEREISILKQVKHPNMIQLYEIIETSKDLSLVMEYISGGELFDYIVEKGKLEEDEARDFFRQIISGTEYLHKLHISHRDLKPENMLLEPNHNVKIVDFGLSNRYKDNEQLETACGSPCYAAPEMVAGKRYSGEAVDIWSSGIVLFAMICGYLPFEDTNTSKLYKKIIKGNISIPNHVSNSANDLIKHILNTDPSTRYTIKDIKNHKWFTNNGTLTWYNLKINEKPLASINTKVMVQMANYGFTDEKKIKYQLSKNYHNRVTVAYHLLYGRILNRMKDMEQMFNIGSSDTKELDDDFSENFDCDEQSIERSFSFTQSSFYKDKVAKKKKKEVIMLNSRLKMGRNSAALKLRKKPLLKLYKETDVKSRYSEMKENKRVNNESNIPLSARYNINVKKMKNENETSKKKHNYTNTVIQINSKETMDSCNL